MLLMQGGPPITRLKVPERSQQISGWYEHHGTIHLPDGLRIGTLWDLTKEWCAWDADASFMVRWRGDIVPDPRRELEITMRERRPHWTDSLRRLLPELPWNLNVSNGGEGVKGVDYRLVILDPFTPIASERWMEELEGEEKDFVEVVLMHSFTCEGGGFGAPPALGMEFQSEGFEKVNVEFGKSERA